MLFHDIVDRASANLYRAALALSDQLEAASNGRRGHPWAPSPRPTPASNQPPEPKPLLVEGDHNLSFRWGNDEAFRDDFVASILP